MLVIDRCDETIGAAAVNNIAPDNTCYHGFTSQVDPLKPSVAGKKRPTADRSAVGFF